MEPLAPCVLWGSPPTLPDIHLVEGRPLSGAPRMSAPHTMTESSRLEERRENELRAARRKLSKFVVDHERHNLKPDDSKMKKMHAEIKRIEGTVQPIRDSVDWLENNGYADSADRVVLGLEKAGYPCSTWLREVSSMKRADLLAFADKYTADLEAKEDQSRKDHEKNFAVKTGASGKAAVEQEARRQRMAVSGGLHVEGAGSRYQEWKKAEKRAKQAEKDQQRAQAEQDAKFRAGMMLKMRKSKAQKNIVAFKNLKEGFKCDARDRYGTWYEANVIATNAKSVKMHFEGREGRYDEWIDRDSDRLALLGSHRGPTEWGLITPANQQKVLWQCILRDDADVLRRLLSEFTVDINSLNKGGQTPLSLAIERGKPAVTALLHTMTGADSQDMEVKTTANAHRRAKESRWGRSGDTDPRRSESEELHAAAGNGDVEEVRRLIAAGLEVDALSQAHHYFGAPIHFAVRGASAITVPHIGTRAAAPGRPSTANHRKVVDVLLDAGGDVDVKDERGHTALMRAASYGDPQLIAQLLAARADPNIADRSGWTALRHATMAGQHDACTVLRGSGGLDVVEETANATKAADVKRLLRAGAAAGVASAWNNNIEKLGQKQELDRWKDAPVQMERAKADEELTPGTRISLHPHGEGTYVAKKRGCCGCGAKKHMVDFGGNVGVVGMKGFKKRGPWSVAQGVVEESGSRWKDAAAQIERLQKDRACATGTRIHVESHGEGGYVSFKKKLCGGNAHALDFGGDKGIIEVKLKKRKWKVVKKWGIPVVEEQIETPPDAKGKKK